jgi:hypothetical protein
MPRKAAPKKPAPKKVTPQQHIERWEQNARYIFEVRQTMPPELREMCNRWLLDMAAIGNTRHISPPEMACAVAAMMSVVIQTHIDCAMADGVEHDTALQQMIDYFDLAARVELGVIAFQHSKEPRH